MDLARSHETFRRITEHAGLATEWRVAHGVIGGSATLEALAQARCADLVILGQTNPDPRVEGVPADLPEAIALWSGRPTLVVPYIRIAIARIRTVVVCWNGSREAARAARDALPLLKSAVRTIVLSASDGLALMPGRTDPGANVVAWLERHGIASEAHGPIAVEGDLGQSILSRAADLGADLLVMGAYGRPRMRELVLGGMTRTILRSMTIPVLMAH